jgi:hypothetical protein
MLCLRVDEYERGSSTIRFAESPNCPSCCFSPGDRHCISEGAECRADGGLIASLNLQECGYSSNDTRNCTLGIEKSAGAITAIQANLQRLEASSSCRPFAIGIRLLRAQSGECAVSEVKSLSSLFMLCIETKFTVVETSDLGLQSMELLLRFLRTCTRICNLYVESFDLSGACLDA